MTDHPIRLRSSADRAKDPRPFVPRDWRDEAVPERERRVRMYVCGPTVYDRAHIGNARPAVVFDALFRLLRHVYGPDHVTYVRNLTDVEDKINDRAAERFPDMPPLQAIARLTRETTEWYHADMDALGVLRPTHEPRATEFIPQMVEMIEALVASGHAYAAEGHVLFAVDSYPDYGRLSGRDTEDMIAGARVEVAPYKRNPMDFVLWKPSTTDQPGWDSPWGRGRPGWHIECSAMSKALLGEDFDIHGGGADLMFPHHENEVAQSCCAAPGHAFAEVWLHNGMIRVEGRKMSKSLGNFTTVADVREQYEREFGIDEMGLAMRFRMLMTHYRDPLDWTSASLEQAATKLGRYWALLKAVESPSQEERKRRIDGSDFLAALCDDLNTAAAISELDETVRFASAGDYQRAQTAIAYLGLLGFEVEELWRFNLEEVKRRRAETVESVHASLIEKILSDRAAARKAKDFARADLIRDTLSEADVIVKDTPQGAEWELGPKFDPSKLEDVK